MTIRAETIRGFRELAVVIIKETLDDLGLIKPAKKSNPKPPPDPKKIMKPKAKKAPAKKTAAKPKKVASILLVFGLASFMLCGNSFALLRPRGMDQVTTKTWTFQSVLVPTALTVTGTTVYSGVISFTGDVDIDAALDVDVPTTSTTGIQFTTVTDAAGGEIGITAGQDVDIDAANDAIITAVGVLNLDGATVDIDATDDITIDVTSGTAGEDILISQVGANDSSIVLTAAGTGTNAIELTTSNVAGDMDINSGDDLTVDAADDITITAVGILDLNGDTIDIDSTDDITIDITSSTGGEDILISQVGANDSSITLTAAGTGADAIGIQASAGGIDIDAVDDINIAVASTTAADDLVIAQTGAFDASIKLQAAGTGSDAISLQATAGAIDIDAIGASDGDITINAGDDLTIAAVGNLDLDGAVTTLDGSTSVAIDGGATLDLDGTAIGIGDDTDTVTCSAAFTAQSVVTVETFIVELPTSTGTTTAYAVDYTLNVSTLTAGLTASFLSHTENTGASTLAIDGLGATNIYNSNDVSALGAADIVEGAVVTVIYDGTQFQVISGNNSN